MSNSKVTLPREVAEAIEYAKDVHGSLTNLLDDVFNCEGSGNRSMEKLAEHFAGDELKLMTALVNGYEVAEFTPEEKVREYYEGERDIARDCGYTVTTILRADGATSGIRKTLDLLGIKIEGVNA